MLENLDGGLRKQRERGAARGFRLLAEGRSRHKRKEKEQEEILDVFSMNYCAHV
jgi:hypothetical protein